MLLRSADAQLERLLLQQHGHTATRRAATHNRPTTATMTLFAALTAKDDNAAERPPSSSSPPEAIQLHSNRVTDFLNGTTVHLLNPANGGDSTKSSGEESTKETITDGNNGSNSGEGQSRYFSALSYQAIQTLQDDGPAMSNQSTASNNRHVRPDLGVWDCRVQNDNAEASAMLLKRVVMKKKMQSNDASGEEKKAQDSDIAAAAVEDDNNKQSPPIVMAVDLSNPTQVQPVLEQMRSVILNVYDAEEKSAMATMPNPHACTTSIKSLQNSTFGNTLVQEEVIVKGGSSSSEDRIALILAAIVPSSNSSSTASSTVSAAEEYQERQARALILYHLYKFSLEVNCTLVFVSEKGSYSSSSDVDGSGTTTGGDDEKADRMAAESNDPLLGRNSTMSIDDLGKVIRRVAMGLSPVELGDDGMESPNNEEKKETNNESKEEDTVLSLPTQRPPSIHVPGSHDSELIHGAYLRNASCEGRWDASKDDLNVALPPHSAKMAEEETTDENKNASSSSSGDEEWLSQLASSIGLSPDAATAATATTTNVEALTPTAAERRKKEKMAVSKKRPVRAASSRHANKDAKPKDEKEVMNFFDNLLKK